MALLVEVRHILLAVRDAFYSGLDGGGCMYLHGDFPDADVHYCSKLLGPGIHAHAGRYDLWVTGSSDFKKLQKTNNSEDRTQDRKTDL